MRFALKVGCLAFDSTRISAAGVDFPIDVLLYAQGSYRLVEHRYEKGDLEHVSSWWQDRLRRSVNELPDQWLDGSFCQACALVLEAENSGKKAARLTDVFRNHP